MSKSYYLAAADEYIKRLKPFTRLNIHEIREAGVKSASADEIIRAKALEGQAITAKTQGYKVALDSGGKELTSEALAELINAKQSSGQSVSFIIGSAYGLSDEVKSGADEIISFGRATFPHQLVRVMLLEQIYRAYSIINNSKYHK